MPGMTREQLAERAAQILKQHDPVERYKASKALKERVRQRAAHERFVEEEAAILDRMIERKPRPIRVVPEPTETLPADAPHLFAGLAALLCGGCAKCKEQA